MRSMLFLLCLLFLLPCDVFADVRLAVLEFRGEGISSGLLKVLADEVRTGVVEISSGKRIKGEKLIIMIQVNSCFTYSYYFFVITVLIKVL